MRTGFSCVLCAFLWLFPSPLLCWPPQSPAGPYLKEGSLAPVVGTASTASVEEGDTLTQIARARGLGYEGLVRANPEIDPWIPEPGRSLLLPYAGILPGPLAAGITVNLPEKRLYHIFRENDLLRVRIYPVGIGISGWETPEGVFTISSRIENPTWIVPPSIGRERPELPRTVPPGPENPLGEYWLGLSLQGYGIHGTSEPFGVGRRVSHGCLRLYPEDIRDLFESVEIGTSVRIFYQPFKVGLKNGSLFLEIHPDYSARIADPLEDVRRQIADLGWRDEVDWEAVREEIRTARGVPRIISGEGIR